MPRNIFSKPVRFLAPILALWAGDFHRRQSVARFRYCAPGASSNLRSPPGLSSPSGSSRLSDCSPGSLPLRVARFPFAPRQQGRFIKLASGSSFRARYFSPGSLFREPLGTLVIMPPNARIVNKNRPLRFGYPHLFSSIFSVICYTHPCGVDVEKTAGQFIVSALPAAISFRCL